LGTGTPSEAHFKFFEVDSYEVWAATDWTPDLLEVFQKRYGYNPEPYLPVLAGYSCADSIISERFRADFNRLVSDLIIENHFQQGEDIAHQHQMQLFAEGGHGGYPRVDPLKAMGHADVPMGEFWNRKQFWVTKEAASAAHIYGKELVAAESLTGWQNWQQGPTDFKQLLDIAFCEGLNQVVFHTFAHNPAIAGKPGFAYHAGEHLNVNTSWWEMARPFMDYIARCSYMLRQGNFVGDVCLYYGDQAPNLVPPDRIDPNIPAPYGEGYCLHCGLPKPVDPGKLPGYDYDYINAEVITTKLQTKNGQLVLPSGQSYKLMLLPDKAEISLPVLRSLDTLIQNGAIVIGRKPERSTSLQHYPDCDKEVQAIAAKIWGACDGKTVFSNQYGKGRVYWGRSVKQVLDELHINPDVNISGVNNDDEHLDYLHRKTKEEDIYFLSNSSTANNRFSALFRVDTHKVPEIWDPVTGKIQRNLQYKVEADGIRLDMDLESLGSRFIVFRDKTSGINDKGLDRDLQFGLEAVEKNATNNSVIDLSTHWSVNFDSAMGGTGSVSFDSLRSWTSMDASGVKYYSGKAVYEKEFDLSNDPGQQHKAAFLQFSDIQEMARVYVNGKDAGIVWLPPYSVNITPYLQKGQNRIRVEVINTWKNRIVGDLKYPDSTQYTHTNIKYKFRPNGPLLPSGLMGDAKIVFIDTKEN
jgi:hypothetical protein